MEPSTKKRRSELDDGVFVLDKLKGRIVLRIEGISKILKTLRECVSEPVRIRGFDWTLLACPFPGPNNGFEFYIYCNGDSRASLDWNCAASITLLCTSGIKAVVEMSRGDHVTFAATSPGGAFICTVRI